MRILALVTDAYGAHGGIARANRDLLDALAVDHQIVVLPRSGSCAGAPANNVDQRKPLRSRVRYALRALLEAGRGRYDLVFCAHLYMAPLAAAAAIRARAPYWLHLYGIEAWQRPHFLLRWAAERASFVTAISRHTRRLFLSWAKVSPDRAKVLPVTFDARFSPGPKSSEILEKYGLKDKKTLLTVARLSARERYKGHDRVIAALPEIAGLHPSVVYLIVGEGDDRVRLESAARAAGVADRVIFAGAVPDADLPAVYRSADVFVMPSTGEGFGIVFLEAAACGIPVVGGCMDGSWDALREGRLGAAIDPRDSEALVSAVDRALSHRAAPAEEVQFFSVARLRAHAAGLMKSCLTSGAF